MPALASQHIIYGPVQSRRLGRSLGVNLLPGGMKVCNMNCAYCQFALVHRGHRTARRARAWPPPPRIEAAVAARLRRASENDELLDRVTIAGHGEPTLHPEFEEIVERLRAVRDKYAPGLRLAVMSNSTTALWPDVQRALRRFDERYMKLDAGDPITYARINGPGPSIADIVDALGGLAPVIVQSMFVTDQSGRIDNTSAGAIADWLAAIDRVKPVRVHIYTFDRIPAVEQVKPVPQRRLREIAEHVRAAGIPADVFANAA